MIEAQTSSLLIHRNKCTQKHGTHTDVELGTRQSDQIITVTLEYENLKHLKLTLNVSQESFDFWMCYFGYSIIILLINHRLYST